jgi:hypothetical protein
MPEWEVKPRLASWAASSPAAAAFPQCVHFTIEPVLAGRPPHQAFDCCDGLRIEAVEREAADAFRQQCGRICLHRACLQ